jgi:DNA-binding transcriptional LysR family regulator
VREQTMVFPEPFAVVLPDVHRLADADEVKLTDLAQDVWICPPAGKADGDLAYLREVCETVGGFTPDFRYANLDTTEIEQLIAAGRGISLGLPTVRELPQMVVKPLAGQPLVWRRVLRWRVDNVPQEVVDIIHQAFVDAYRQTLVEHVAVRPWWDAYPAAHPTILEPARDVP